MRPERGPRRTVEVSIDSLGTDGAGAARWRGAALLVPGTLPGERVRADILTDAGGRSIGRVLEVLTPAEARVVPACPHAGPGARPSCGGCTWQHIDYDAQLRLKQALVQRVVHQALRRPPDVQPTRPTTPPWHFRHKVHFAAAVHRGRVLPAHYAPGTRHLVPVRVCPAHAEAGNAAAFAFMDAISASGTGAALHGWLGRVSHADHAVAVTLVTRGPASRAFRSASQRLLDGMAGIASIAFSEHDGRSSQILGSRPRVTRGGDRLREVIDGVSYLMSPGAFFQTNVPAATHLVREVLAAIPLQLPVLDLYCGGGLFSLPLAARGHRVLGVEGNEDAVADAVASRYANHIPAATCRFVAAPAESALRAISPRDARVVILDPPRSGVSPSVLREVVNRLKPDLLVYVSCSVESLGRDLAVIENGNYRVSHVRPVDMFPHTSEVETVAIAVRNEKASSAVTSNM